MSRPAPVCPRQHVHRGILEVAAFWFDPALLGEREARERVLAGWTSGASVFEVAGGWLMRLARPRREACATAPGLPLTLESEVLLSAPLSGPERARLAPPAGSAVLVRAGRAEIFPLDASCRVDVAAWLEVSGWSLLRVKGLGAPPPPVTVLEPVAVPQRSAFGPGLPALAPEAQRMRARMKGDAEAGAAPLARSGSVPVPWWTRWRAWLQTRWRRAEPPPGAPASGGFVRASGNAARKPPSQARKLFSRFSTWMLRSTPLGALLGQRQAEYVRRLFDMFEQGDLQEALRYAIPLGSKMTEPERVALGLPGPRESLTLRPRSGGAASMMVGGTQVYDALKERYRAAFQRLKREGRIDEAAFVLTELLGAHEEAVSFLEEHGRLRLAAELAEGRDLPPGLVVRQWLLAKEPGRAVAIARRSGAFADAVLRLEASRHPEARTLRRLWAETLAETGDFLRAVTVIWPLEEEHPRARAWLEQSLAVGGVGGARALARLVAFFPETFETVRGPVLALLEDGSRERAAERSAFATALSRESQTDAASGFEGAVVRALLRDRAAGHTRLEMGTLSPLLKKPGCGPLRTDLPKVPAPPRPAWGEDSQAGVLTEFLAAAEAGPYPIHDAVALSGQRTLVALGEAGVRLLRADGTRVAHFDVPAFALVPSVHEDRLVALAPRGELQRLSRIDLGTRRAVHWCDARVDAFAPTHDGNWWFIAEGDTVMAVDVLESGAFRALWRVSQLEGPVVAVAADSEWLRFVTWNAPSAQYWNYTLENGPTLRSRLAQRSGANMPLVALNPVTGKAERVKNSLFALPWVLRISQEGLNQEACLYGQHERLWGRFVFEGEGPMEARFSGDELLVFDKMGRLLRVDLTEGTVLRLPLG
ncbi:bpX6 domain-containing protein [Stigmatella sp. ncwal1]|uniref:BpX6 domain-containing protein n=1 Tax=Stigmatella ashevillensis TaxID=2995309 RepID=A0ABT5DJU7_9BACT|nr:bpX6 domain-containing protein [Stigmatella ashevillena]MDC0712636.1 bpX6 domain-containing protein [Stigmatella ashevillena]